MAYLTKLILSTAALLLLLIGAAWAQVNQDSVQVAAPKLVTAPELRHNLSADGKLYLKATFLNQTWVRFNESNAGTQVLGVAVPNTFDVGLRRTRIQLFGQVSKYAFVYFQFGQNNVNFLSGNNAAGTGNRKLQAFFHDALCEFTPLGDKLKLGAGLTIVSGLSRFRQPSIGTIMTLDVPVFAQVTVDQTDEFSRMLSVYARGMVGKVDYRIAVSDPFPISSNGQVQALKPGSAATFAPKKHDKQYQAYLAYNFFDAEPSVTPGYMTGTYLGKKKVFNIAAGVITQRNASWRRNPDAQALGTADSALYTPMQHWCVESFLDMPLNVVKQTAISAYAGYFNLDYGPDYLRYNGVMNPASGVTPGNGHIAANSGNAYPMFGTGQVVYSQLGYLMPANLLGSFGTLLPYATVQLANFKALSGTICTYGAGVNWLIDGHRAKLTLEYQNRADYQQPAEGKPKEGARRSSLTLQYQIFI